MDLEQQLAQAIRQELERQAEEGRLRLRSDNDDSLHIEGAIDLQALAMAVAGHVAGGP